MRYGFRTAWIAVALLMFLAAGALSRAQAPVPVGGTVFEDTNGNGRRDSGERGLAGVAVSNQREVVKTGSDGAYRLSGCRIRPGLRQHSGWLPFRRAILAARSRIGARPGPVDFALTVHRSACRIHVHPRIGHARQPAEPRAPPASSAASPRRDGPISSSSRATSCATRSASARRKRAAITISMSTRLAVSRCQCGACPGTTKTSASSATCRSSAPKHPLLRQGHVSTASRPELLLLYLWRRALRRARHGGHCRPLVRTATSTKRNWRGCVPISRVFRRGRRS